jgi:hypothetical protein
VHARVDKPLLELFGNELRELSRQHELFPSDTVPERTRTRIDVPGPVAYDPNLVIHLVKLQHTPERGDRTWKVPEQKDRRRPP